MEYIHRATPSLLRLADVFFIGHSDGAMLSRTCGIPSFLVMNFDRLHAPVAVARSHVPFSAFPRSVDSVFLPVLAISRHSQTPDTGRKRLQMAGLRNEGILQVTHLMVASGWRGCRR